MHSWRKFPNLDTQKKKTCQRVLTLGEMAENLARHVLELRNFRYCQAFRGWVGVNQA